MGAAPYVDPATGILINKLGLTDADALQWAEGFHTKLAARDALNFADGARHLNEETFKQIHRMLFGAVYEWAGEFRCQSAPKFDPSSACNVDPVGA